MFATICDHVTVAPRDRLAELERQMVGGEEASNEEVRERHQLKIKHVEERKRKLQGTSRDHISWQTNITVRNVYQQHHKNSMLLCCSKT